METKLFTLEQVHSIAQSVASKVCANDVSLEYVIDLVERYGDSKMYIDSEKAESLIYAETVDKIIVDIEFALSTEYIKSLQEKRLNGEELTDEEHQQIHDYLYITNESYKKSWDYIILNNPKLK